MNEYTDSITREIITVSDADLSRERLFQKGKKDRLAGLPCSSANRAYLNGWYSPETQCYYITKDVFRLLFCADSPNGKHSFTADLEYDSTGNTVNCEYCGEMQTHDRK